MPTLSSNGWAAGSAAVVLGLVHSPAAAEVTAKSPAAFTIALSRSVKAPPARVFAALADPARWWSAAHTYSQSSAKLTLDPRAGGCFCETWGEGNSVEHGRVLMVLPGKTLRLASALGPLQQFPVAAVLTVTLAPSNGGTTIAIDYKVAGPAAAGLEALAPAVDQMLSQQLDRLAALSDRE